MSLYLETDEDSEISEEFYRLVEVGIVIVNTYRVVNGTRIVVSAREDIDYTCNMVQWYAMVRHLGTVVNVNMERWADRGQLTFLVAG